MQEIINRILFLDKWLFLQINRGFENSLFDFIAVYFRNPGFWIPVYGFIITQIILNSGKKGLSLLGVLLLTFLLTDQVSSSVIKPLFHRLRPCNDSEMLPYLVSRIKCGSGYSFVSSHAANHFGISIFLGNTFYKTTIFKYLLLFWAFAVSFSQVYVGVHFPLDIFFGGTLGILIAFFTSKLYNKNISKIV